MFTWTSKGLAGLACLVAVAGCDTLPVAQQKGDAKISLTETVVGGLQIRAPIGFCVDHESSSSDGTVILPCRSLGRDGFDWPEPIAVLTTSIGGRVSGDGLGSPEELDAFFKSDDAKALISRTGVPQTVTVLGTWPQPDTFFVRVQDTSATPFGRGYQTHWRAVTVIEGRAVTITSGGYGKNQVSEQDGLKILRTYLTQLRAANSQNDAQTGKKGLLGSLR
ncbi:hypothetical protein [Nereida sp. MMG025]|uniref:hypothetical protein n=1 Tax=Nereida sp. MMG025 TaxID=2909981 RepID=UPI001F28B41D|nr:hypothetical protein [Nereida sp. MMG025]MCF6444442.1 hypothetical protein [Nereida sp. MMG025]